MKQLNSAINILRQLAINEMIKGHPNYPEHLTKPIKSYSDKTANGLTKCIIDWINMKGGYAERINCMGRPLDRRKIVTNVIGQQRMIGSLDWIPGGATPGTADISATINGRSIKI